MAITAAPFALKNLGLDAEPLRQAVASLIPNGGGIVQPGDLAVTQTGTPSLGVLVGVGRAWMPGTNTANLSGQTYSTQGQYFALNDAPFTVNLATADPTNPRIDLIYIGAVDTQYGGASNIIKIDKVTGTPNATPAVPTLPANSIALGQVAVAANAANVTNANITPVAVGVTKHAEWNSVSSGLASAVVYNIGGCTPIASATTDPNFYSIAANVGITPSLPGAYLVTLTQHWSTQLVNGTRAFVELSSGSLGSGTLYARNEWGDGDDTTTTTACVWVPAGGAIYCSAYQASGSVLNISGLVTIQKVG